MVVSTLLLVVDSQLRSIELLRLRERLSAFTPAFCFIILVATMPQNRVANL